MLRRTFDTWQKRLVIALLGVLAGAMWLPLTYYLQGKTVTHGLISQTSCYMEPEFYENNGVSARQICSGGDWQVTHLATTMVDSLTVIWLPAAIGLVVFWIIAGPKRQEPEDDQVPVVSHREFPEFAPRTRD